MKAISIDYNGYYKEGYRTYIAAHLWNAIVGAWNRSKEYTGVNGTCIHQNNTNIYPYFNRWPKSNKKPTGRFGLAIHIVWLCKK